jgi:hypothetical protein
MSVATQQSDKSLGFVRTLEGEYEIQETEELTGLIAKWADTLRSPQSWNRAAANKSDLRDDVSADLKRLGLKDADLRSIAQAGLVEVKITCSPARLAPVAHLPWEFMLTTATEKLRSQPLLVLRHLDCNSSGSADLVPERLMIVKSSPGFLAEIYSQFSLEIEETNIAGNLAMSASPGLWNPNLVELRSAIEKNSPNIIHMAGIDITQARELSEEEECTVEEQESLKNSENEGMSFLGTNGLPVGVSPDALAEILCSSREVMPSLVAYNFYNSTILAAAAVRRGARVAIGCQGEMEDLLAEIFYCNFYLAWRLGKWRILDAYRLATAELRDAAQNDPARGQTLIASDFVLWSGHSLLDQEKRESLRKKPKSLVLPPEQLRNDFETTRMLPAQYAANSKPISVHIAPRKELNYSLLHNNRSLFSYFYIRKIPPLGQIQNIAVEIVLLAGNEEFRYRARKDLKYTLWMLGEEIRVPITSRFARSVRESMYTSLLVKISIAELVVFEQTFRVALLPVDQWQDDKQNRKWLPSFVLPRDPEVLQVVESGQKYLLALADDSAAGFDGYQNVSEDGVDNQVRAIWYALAYQHSISYINPPPTFTHEAQRLRSPSDVLRGGRGTCIDLALVLASCLEHVEVYPVLFLLEGHAFPGYYRAEKTHQEVREWLRRNGGSDDEDAWMLGDGFYPQLLDMIKRGDLIPLETTFLTKHGGFWDAVEEGIFNLSSKEEFQFLVDIKLARENGVTPLPLWDES